MAAATVEAVEGQERLVGVEPTAIAVLERRPVDEEKSLRRYDPEQVLLLAPVLSEWVPKGDLAHFVSDWWSRGALDLSEIYAAYVEERGYPPPSTLAHRSCGRRPRDPRRLPGRAVSLTTSSGVEPNPQRRLELVASWAVSRRALTRGPGNRTGLDDTRSEERQLHSLGCLHAHVAVSPRGVHRATHPATPAKPGTGRLEVVDGKCQPDGPARRASALDLVHVGRVSAVEQLERGAARRERYTLSCVHLPLVDDR